MKLQKLTIHNIASIEDAVIDFDGRPLNTSEVFLISGKTGAGKSTILDAICLALYATTPRLENTNMQGESKDGKQEVKIYDPRQLMRRHTGEAFVELTFTGSNGVRYEARWSVARARNKPSGNLQGKKWQLKNLDGNHLLTKDKEIEEEITAAVGLGFSQFCRTTMLAQGEFTRFLNSNDKDKAEILEKITGVDIYSKIGRKVYEVASEKEQVWREAARLVEGVRVLNGEEIDGYKATINAIDEEIALHTKRKETSESKLAWIDEEARIAQQEKEAAESLDEAKAKTESGEAKARAELVRLWNETIEPRATLRELNTANQNMHALTEAVGQDKEEYARLKGAAAWMEDDLEKTQKRLGDVEKALDDDKDRAYIYEKVQTIGALLGIIGAGRKRIAAEIAKKDKEEQRLKGTLTEDKMLKKETCDKAGENLRIHNIRLKANEQDLADRNLSGMRHDKERLQQSRLSAERAIERLDALDADSIRYRNRLNNIVQQEHTITALNEKLRKLNEDVRNAEITTAAYKTLLDKQRETVDKWAKAMRSKLHPGDVCPVCMQKIEARIPDEERINELFEAAEKVWKDADDSLSEMKDREKTLSSELKVRTKALENVRAEHERDTALATCKKEASEAVRKCGIDEIDEYTRDALNNKITRATVELDGLAKKIAEAETLENSVKTDQKEADRLRAIRDIAKTELEKAERAIADSAANIRTSDELIGSKTEEVDNARISLKEILGVSTWQNDVENGIEAFEAELTAAATLYEANKKACRDLKNEIKEKRTLLEHSSRPLASILALMPAWEDAEAPEIKEVKNAAERANNLHTRIHSALAQAKTAKATADKASGALTEYYALHPDISPALLGHLDSYQHSDITSIAQEFSRLRDESVRCQAILSQTIARHNAHTEKKPEIQEEDSAETLKAMIMECKARQDELLKDKGRITLLLEQDEHNKHTLAALIADAEARKADYEQWHRMNELIGDAAGNKFRKIAQSYVLTSLIHTANSYMRMLTDRYTLKVAPGTFVIMLEDAYQGYASRAASTISGGEGFLVSLALALALSDIGDSLSVDTLFIDEGFGTLSGEPLQRAIDTLRSLHGKYGRHVGIISHVEELKERIPVQIQVNQEGNNSSSEVRVVPSESGG